jgi:hypothetical protein
MNVYASGWYTPNPSNDPGRNFDHNGWDCHGNRAMGKNGDTWAYRRHKGSRRRKRFHCVNLKMGSNGQYKNTGHDNNNKNDYMRWGSGDQGHHPCKNIGESYTYRNNAAFPGAHFGFKCTVPANKIHSLINGNTSHVNAAGAHNSAGTNKTIREQLLFGATMKGGQQTGTGYCLKKEHLAVKFGNQTCFQLIAAKINQAKADQLARDYCKTGNGRKDPKCKCLNVAGSTFIRDCRANPSWAGCNEIMPRITGLQKLLKGSNLREADFGNADCIVPGICSGSVYRPLSGVPSCAKKMEVCNQVMNQKNVKAYGDLKAIQSCNFTGSNSLANVQKKRDAAAAAKKKAAAAAVKKKRDDAAKKKRDAAAKKKKAAAAKKKKAAAAAAAKKKKAATAAAAKKTGATQAQAAAGATAAKKKAAAAAAAAAAKKAGATPAEAAAAGAAAAASTAPAAGVGLAKPGGVGMGQNAKIGVGVGILLLSCCCLVVMMMMMGGGGGGDGGGGRRRR